MKLFLPLAAGAAALFLLKGTASAAGSGFTALDRDAILVSLNEAKKAGDRKQYLALLDHARKSGKFTSAELNKLETAAPKA